MNEPTVGLFVALEGIDGAGKTTTARAIAQLAADDDRLVVLQKKDVYFTDPLVRNHMKTLRTLLWGDWAEDPFYRMGPRHWAFLMASWFETMNHALIDPHLSAGRTVIVDTWIYKFMARLSTKPAVPPSLIDDVFRHIRRPDQVVLLELSPEHAAQRKTTWTHGETGNEPSEAPMSTRFVRHQTAIRRYLDDKATTNEWRRVRVDALDQWSVVEAVMTELARIGVDVSTMRRRVTT